MGKTKEEIQKRHNDILVELDKIEERAQKENRAFTAEENAQYDALMREDNRLHIEMQGMLDEKQLAQFREIKTKNQKLRELLKQCVANRESHYGPALPIWRRWAKIYGNLAAMASPAG